MDPVTAFIIGNLLATLQLSVSNMDLPFWFETVYPAFTGIVLALFEWHRNKKTQSCKETTKEAEE